MTYTIRQFWRYIARKLCRQRTSYQLVWQGLRDSVQGNGLRFQKKDNPKDIIDTHVSCLDTSLDLIEQIDSRDAYRLGKEAGIRERLAEEALIRDEN